MSYARFSNGDVYVYHHVYGYIICCCSENFITTSREKMITHLIEHVNKGDKVPDRAFVRLQEEIDEVGDDISLIKISIPSHEAKIYAGEVGNFHMIDLVDAVKFLKEHGKLKIPERYLLKESMNFIKERFLPWDELDIYLDLVSIKECYLEISIRNKTQGFI